MVSNDGVTVKMEDDPILDQVLDTVAAQSEIVDSHKDEKPVLHLQPNKAAAQGILKILKAQKNIFEEPRKFVEKISFLIEHKKLNLIRI